MEAKIIDPGNEFSGPKSGSLAWLIGMIRKHPDLNLKTGEGKMLVDEIDRLNLELEKLRENKG